MYAAKSKPALNNIRKIFNLGLVFAMAIAPMHTAAAAATNTAAASTSPAKDNSAANMAKQLANPIATLISVPFHFNYDANLGPNDDGERLMLNIQPVVPFSLNEDWNIISRTILPVISQQDVLPESGDQSGIGDIVQSLFLSPSALSKSGWVWGVGPVFLLPTGSDDLLTTDKWGLGPTAVALKQQGHWTYGALVNHIWSYAGDDDRGDVNTTFMQPFLSYTTTRAYTFTAVTETTYDWESEQWSIPLIAMASRVIKIGDQVVSVGAGARYWADSPDNGPEGWGGRIMMTFLFPR